MNGESKVEVITREGWRKEYPLRKGIVYIGSAASNDIVLNGMQGGGVAPLHAQLIANQAGYKLINLAEAEIRLGEGGGDVLPPRAVIDMVDGLTFGLGEFTLVFRGSGGGYDLGAASGSGTRFIGLKLAMPYVRLAPNQSLDGKVIVQNLGGKTGVRFDIDLEGLDTDCYDVAPGPLLSSGAAGEVLFRIHHRGLKPLAGAWTITLRATAPRDYPGEAAVVSQDIEVLPFYRHQLRLFSPGSAPEAIEPQDFLTPKAKSGSLTDQEESRSKGKKGKWWTAHPSWGDEQEEPVRMRAKPAPQAKPAETAATTPAASADSDDEPWGWQAKEAGETSGRANTRPVVVAGEGEWGQADEAEEAAQPSSPKSPVEPDPVEKKSEGNVSGPSPPVAAPPPQTAEPAPPPPEQPSAVSEPVAVEPAPVSVSEPDDKQADQSEVVQRQLAVQPGPSLVEPSPVVAQESAADVVDLDDVDVEETVELSWWQRLKRAWPFGRRAEPDAPDPEVRRQADEPQTEAVEEPRAALVESSPPLPSPDEAPAQDQAPPVAGEILPSGQGRAPVESEPVSPEPEPELIMKAEVAPPLTEEPDEQPASVPVEPEPPSGAEAPSQPVPATPLPAETQPAPIEAEATTREVVGAEPSEAEEAAEVGPPEPEPPKVVTEPPQSEADDETWETLGSELKPEPVEAEAAQSEADDETWETSAGEPETKPVKVEAAPVTPQPEVDDEAWETFDDEPEPRAAEAETATATATQSEAEDETGEASDVESEVESDVESDEGEDWFSESEPAPAATTEAAEMEAAETEAEEAEDWLAFGEKKERKVIKLRADTDSLPVQKKAEKQSEIEELWTAD